MLAPVRGLVTPYCRPVSAWPEKLARDRIWWRVDRPRARRRRNRVRGDCTYLLTHVHESGHLVLRELNLLAAPGSERNLRRSAGRLPGAARTSATL